MLVSLLQKFVLDVKRSSLFPEAMQVGTIIARLNANKSKSIILNAKLAARFLPIDPKIKIAFIVLENADLAIRNIIFVFIVIKNILLVVFIPMESKKE